MTLRIKDWKDRFEHKNSTHKAGRMAWVRISTSFDGAVYSEMMCRSDGGWIKCCWVSIIQIAATCEPRGTLIKPNGKPHDAVSMGALSRIESNYMQDAIDFLLEYGELEETDVKPAKKPTKNKKAIPKAKVVAPTSPQDLPIIPPLSPGPHGIIAPKRVEGRGKRVEEENTLPSTPSQTQLFDPLNPTFPVERKPTPKDVLTVFDAIFERRVGIPYIRTCGPKEAALSAKLIKAIGDDDSDWSRIPASIEAGFDDEWFHDKAGFSIYASQFQKYDMAARGLGKKPNFAVEMIKSGLFDKKLGEV